MHENVKETANPDRDAPGQPGPLDLSKLELIIELGIMKTLVERLLAAVRDSADQELHHRVMKLIQDVMAGRPRQGV